LNGGFDVAVRRPVVLTKDDPRISIPRDRGQMVINLSWNARQAPIDLDLCCLWELTDGAKGCVQALGGKFTVPRNGPDPIIALDRDDRRGEGAGENIRVDMGQADRIRRILVFAHIYDGVPNWAAADAVATVRPVSGPPIEVKLDQANPHARVCAIAMVQGVGGELRIRREVRYFVRGHRAMDAAYGWGLGWGSGRKV